MRRFFAAVAAAALAVPASAQFTGDYTVGPGGDYTSLRDAAANLSTGTVVGNVNFIITDDLTETDNTFFGVNPAGFTITIKPDDNISPTITFTRTNDNAGASGNLIIGASADNTNWGAALVKTDGFTIDGSNNLGNRQLTLATSGVTHSFNSIITVVGDSDNVVIRNARIINPNPGGGGSIGGIRIASRQQTILPAGTYVPDGFQILNNEITATAGSQGVGINMTGSGTIPAGTGNSNWLVENNDINARIRGIFVSQGLTNSTVHNNRIAVGATGGTSGFASGGIHVNTANTPPAHTFTVSNNRIFVSSNNATTGANGPSGIILTTMGSGSDRIANVYNNMVTVALTSTNANTTQVYRGIWASSGIAHRFFNNSIYMPGNTNHSLNTLTSFGIGGWTAVGKEAQFRNNLIRVGGGAVAGIMMDNTGSIGAGILSDNNVITPTGGAFFGRWATANHGSRVAWNGVNGLDANSDDTFDPVTSTGSQWSLSPSGNLLFTPNTTKPDGLPGYLRVSAPVNVTTDIEGDARFSGAGESYPGADEIPGQPLPVELTGFQVE